MKVQRLQSAIGEIEAQIDEESDVPDDGVVTDEYLRVMEDQMGEFVS